MQTLLQINSGACGSTGHIAESIGLLAIKNGWKSYIAYGRKGLPSESSIIKIGTKWDVILHGIKTRLFDRHGFGSKHATIKLINTIIKIKPNIIHLHNVHGYYINIEILFNFLALANIPVVWTLHDCWAITGHCAHFDRVGCFKWKTGCYSCPLKKGYTSSLWCDNSKMNYREKRLLFNSVNDLTLVPVSMWLEDIVNKSFLKEYPSKVINNGVDLSIFSPQEQKYDIRRKIGIDDRFMIVGIASIWAPHKGFGDFLELSKYIDDNMVIVLVGLNKKQIKGLPSNIIGISRTENVNELAEIYSASDIFLNLTYADTFPTTNIESLACGTPILTYNTCGSIESVSPDTGFIVEKGDLFGVMKSIRIVKKKGKLSYSKACRNRSVSLYDKDDRFQEYFKLYDHLLEATQ